MSDCGNCRSCCSVHIPCLKSELKAIKKYCEDNNIVPQQSKGEDMCKYLNDQGRCSIYLHRPKTCEVFGKIKNKHMQCPKHPERVQRYDETFDKYGKKVLSQDPVPTLDD